MKEGTQEVRASVDAHLIYLCPCTSSTNFFMSTLSFFVRVTLWAVAGIFLFRVVFVGTSQGEIVVFVLLVIAALLHSWFDKKEFSVLIRDHAMEPVARIKKVILGPGESHQIYRDTYYHRDTPKAVVHLLDTLREKYTHTQIHYGNVETGREEHVVTGYLERSVGSPRVMLLIQLGEPGGVPILDHHIVRLVELDKDWVSYQHPAYHQQPEEYPIRG